MRRNGGGEVRVPVKQRARARGLSQDSLFRLLLRSRRSLTHRSRNRPRSQANCGGISKHDIWDYDLAGAPLLVAIDHGGKKIPAVVFTSKAGLVFILDRRTGKPVYGVEEKRVPQGDASGEHLSPTQPFPLKPPPLGRMEFKSSDNCQSESRTRKVL